VAPDGIISTWSQRFLHPAARSAFAGGLEHDRADAEAAVLECMEIESGGNEVSAQQAGSDRRHAHKGRDGREILRSNQGHLSRPVMGRSIPVTLYANSRGHRGRLHRFRRDAAAWPHTDPFQAPRSHGRGKKATERRLRRKHIADYPFRGTFACDLRQNATRHARLHGATKFASLQTTPLKPLFDWMRRLYLGGVAGSQTDGFDGSE
jgi:hypothetical protein